MSKIAFLFSGGGAQYPGMMKELYKKVPDSRTVFERANAALERDITRVIFEGTQEELNQTGNMLPAIFTADMAAYAAISTYGIKPDYVAGFSLGEWVAVTAAGALPFDEAIRLVQLRSNAMVDATPAEGAGMAVVLGKPNEYVEELCSRVTAGYVCPANYNYSGQITVSGTNAGLAELEKMAEMKGVAYKRLPVNVPSHCILMESARQALEKALYGIEFARPVCPVVPNATAEPTEDPKEIKSNIIEQLIRPVLFEQTVQKMLDIGVDCFIELGPGKTLAGFVRKTARKLGKTVNIQHVENMDTLLQSIKR